MRPPRTATASAMLCEALAVYTRALRSTRSAGASAAVARPAASDNAQIAPSEGEWARVFIADSLISFAPGHRQPEGARLEREVLPVLRVVEGAARELEVGRRVGHVVDEQRDVERVELRPEAQIQH